MIGRGLLLRAVQLLALAQAVAAHARWKCPPPRDAYDDNGVYQVFANTGNKNGPCGPDSGIFGKNGVRHLKPGWQTLVWEESISHGGSPFRIAILDRKENVKAILLDHIPHWDDAAPIAYVEKTYVEYKMSVFIPDIKCEECVLQLLYFMTDKTTKCDIEHCQYYPEDSACSGHTDASQGTCFGAPNSNPCLQPDTCFSNYHSCSDVTILGSIPVDDVDILPQPEEWPFVVLPGGKYTFEASAWKHGWLVDIPSNFTTPAGSLKC